MSAVNYPPKEIYKDPVLGKKNFEHIILWMLYNNEDCEWASFTETPLELRLSTLSKYLSLLKGKKYVEKISRGHYRITSEGKKRFLELSKDVSKKRKLSYPPDIIRKKRNYDHWILWMVYNNNYCKWADFLAEPLSINQSSLSKNMNLLLDLGYIEKENKEYRITQSGKLEYSRMLQDYDLDRQSILDEESKRIEEITRKTISFFEKYSIDDENLQFRFLHNVLRLDYTRVESMLSYEEDFNKILLYISINHPDEYPNYMSIEDFSKKYQIKQSKLEYYIDEIVENNIYPIKFFKLIISPEEKYYFPENEKLEIMLRAITEGHITKFTYLNKLFSRPMNRTAMVNDILEEICEVLFDDDLNASLKDFLPEYINYLAYKIEAKVEFKESLDKLEGIIWQDMIEIFQSNESEDFEQQYKEELEEINKQIGSDPTNLDLYYSKIKILVYFDQFDDVLDLLDEMLEMFPDYEKDINMQKASVLRRMQKVEAGLEIINNLLKKFPEDYNLLNYKAYWFYYLNKEEDAIKLIKEIIEHEPDNATYHDTYGEISMFFKDYDKAIEEFQKTLNLATDDWYLNQTYIKLGICYKELENYKAALENLQKGKDLTKKASIDPETKKKWLVIADLFISEISQLGKAQKK
ncbi:MAG: hypothetical protein ACFFB0_08775 [Promethearchaeota archaeon]